MKTITLITKNGDEVKTEIRYRWGDFAVHQDILSNSPELWKISHVPSGRGIAQCHSLRVACYITAVLATLPGEWPKGPFNGKEDETGKMIMAAQHPKIRHWLSVISKNVTYGDVA